MKFAAIKEHEKLHNLYFQKGKESTFQACRENQLPSNNSVFINYNRNIITFKLLISPQAPNTIYCILWESFIVYLLSAHYTYFINNYTATVFYLDIYIYINLIRMHLLLLPILPY